MDATDFYSGQDPSKQLSIDGSTPSIGDIKADFINFYNIASGSAKSADYGAAVGGAAGAIFGGPQGAQFGANIGRKVFPVVNSLVRGPVVGGLTDVVAGAARAIGGGAKDIVSGVGDMSTSAVKGIEHGAESVTSAIGDAVGK